jgi:NitT/TauT family transport system ATP-binding protein
MAARPGRVVADLTVNAPWPRSEDFRVSAGFAAEAARVSQVLKGTLDDRDIDH